MGSVFEPLPEEYKELRKINFGTWATLVGNP